MTRGSEWHIWDLHVHTPYSSLNNQFGDQEAAETWNNYVTKLEQEAAAKNIVGLGITDYFTIDGYKKLYKFKQHGRLANLLILPNIEFRVDQVIYRDKLGKEPKRLNMHVLFSPVLSPNQIEEKFLHDLDFVFENDPFESATTFKLKRGNLAELGKKLREQHPPFAKSHNSDFELGCMNAIVKVGQIDKLLKEGPFRGKYIIVLAEEDLSILDWNGQHHVVRKQLLQMSHALFSANPKTRAFCLGETHPNIQTYIDEFKSAKPCLWGCDSHGFDERFLEPDDKRYCWIKGEVTWEGLRQVIFEPEDRVRVQEACPESTKSIYSLKHLHIPQTKITPSLTIDSFDTPVNSNLVTIIGGRGSGKTALLDLIASCFNEGTKLLKIPTSFYARIFQGDENVNSIPITLALNSNESFTVKVGDNHQGIFSKADILYLTQDHFELYAADPSLLNKHVVDLVFDKQPDERPVYDSYSSERDEHQKLIQRTNLEIQLLRAEISGRVEQESALVESKKGEIENFTTQLSRAETTPNVEGNATRALTERLAILRSEVRSIESLLLRLTELQERTINFRNSYREVTASINQDVAQLQDSIGVSLLPDDVEALGEIGAQIAQIRPILETKRVAHRNDIAAVNQQLSVLQGIDKTIADLQQRRDQAKLEIQQAEMRLVDINAKVDHIKALEHDRQQAYANMIVSLLNQQRVLQSAIAEFEGGKDDLLSNVSFSATIDFSGEKEYIEALAERVDNRVHSEKDVRQQLEKILRVLTALRIDDASLLTTAQQIAFDLVQSSMKFRLKSRVSESDFLDLILADFLDIGLDIKFNDKHLTQLSMGERAVVLLKIMLALDDRPLLIDQPENHLDNRYIYDELKPAFRKAKTKRQIIIATHNANLVVNTDAEQVIIAENTNGCIKFSAGTLEDAATREQATKILEGGKEAFQKREERYGYRI